MSYFWVSGGEKQRVFVLETGSKAEIGALVASYHPALNNAIREADAPFRKVSEGMVRIL